jgi:predicted RNase H-like HicB family nuclease
MNTSIIGFALEIIVEPDGNEFHAYCTALKGLHTSGTTEKEALSNAVDAAKAYLASSIRHNDPIPIGIMIKEEQTSKTIKAGRSHYIENLKIPCTA